MESLGILSYDLEMMMESESTHSSAVVMDTEYVPGLIMVLIASVLPSFHFTISPAKVCKLILWLSARQMDTLGPRSRVRF